MTRRPLRARLASGAVASVVFIVSLVLLGDAMGVRQTSWIADQHLRLSPIDHEGASAYDYDLLTRSRMVPTYAAMVDAPRFARRAGSELGLDVLRENVVSVTGSQREALVTVTATSTDPVLAEALSLRVAEYGRDYVNDLQRGFWFGEAIEGTVARPVVTMDPGRFGLALLASLILAVLGHACAEVVRSRRSIGELRSAQGSVER